MAYVDLNPVRAGISQCLEDSDFTSIQERIQAYQKNRKNKQTAQEITDKYTNQPCQLLPFDAHPDKDDTTVMPSKTIKKAPSHNNSPLMKVNG